jgi:folate-binding protein YgfZ
MNIALQDTSAAAGPSSAANAEFRALASGCGVYDLSSRVKVELTGKDRTRWLNGMITNNIRDLAAGRGVYGFLLNPQGHILGDLYAFNRGESILLDVAREQQEKLLATLRRYIIMDKVELADVSESLTGVSLAGPKARETLRGCGCDLPELEPLQFADLSWHEIPVSVVRGDNPAIDTLELWISPQHSESVRQRLLQAGSIPVNSAALELLRVASGIPRYGQDIRERDLPHETEQLRALNFTKGCYIGQEIVERIRSRGAVHRKFTGFLVGGLLPPVETKIQADGKDVGEITSVASLPLKDGELKVALGYLRKEAAQPGKLIEAGGAKLTTTSLPFADAFQH